MSFIFKNRKKSPNELVKSTRKHIDILHEAALKPDTDEKIVKKVSENALRIASHCIALLSIVIQSQSSQIDKNFILSNRQVIDNVLRLFRFINLSSRYSTYCGSNRFDQSMEKITYNLSSMKFMLYGDAENEPKEGEISRLTEELFSSPVLSDLLIHIKLFEFEARKDVASIYNFILRQEKQQSIAYIQSNESILQILVAGYADSEIALNCGSILREVIRHEELCSSLLHNETLFDSFFEYVQMNTFDVASDAFATFKLMLCKHKALSAKFLDANFDMFVNKYNVLLQSRNYVTKRQSLKLLGELLLNRANFAIMMKYINSADNLKIMMNLLRGNTKAIQFEAFHVFKIFVANPKKSAAVIEILARNKRKLIEFLAKFQRSNGADGKPQQEDDQFTEEKATLIRTLEALEEPPPPPATTTSTHQDNNSTTNTLAKHTSDATPQNSSSVLNPPIQTPH